MDGSKGGFSKKSEISEAERKRMTIEETQTSLPVYPFKDDLIEAVKEHQVYLHIENSNLKLLL